VVQLVSWSTKAIGARVVNVSTSAVGLQPSSRSLPRLTIDLFSVHLLGRFAFDPKMFSSSRPDAATFSMAGVKQEGLLNLTDLTFVPSYFSKPHYRGQVKCNID
jgi:hypothetical protein